MPDFSSLLFSLLVAIASIEYSNLFILIKLLVPENLVSYMPFLSVDTLYMY